MKKILAAGLIGLGLVGCATTSGLAPKVTTSGFDGSKRVFIDGHSVACDQMACPLIGAIWLSNNPNLVGLKISVINSIVSINSVDLNIDGEIIKLRENTLTDFSTGTLLESSKVFVTDLTVVDKILNSKRAWIRVNTSKGLIENPIIDGTKDSKAYHALKRFKDQLSTVK
ncbi:hypothetical protein L2634_08855 [Acinetobacter baumannii]|uniref:hypothetical protein n=1 Tax=Acinetobacter baumannii TaxID=470 RepID=UPI0002AE8C61|nr:hypothetical protein [Acinetobacter baumannii]EHU1255483.1 hypothetical protein [Acinetobacter baumannii]EHU1283797.1 hypothetical protein [Acinetobacter baumannii]EHU1368415.1 hypothetical protein [Acinetobacter baumannii]EHU1388744.1 hypothetical protein [Acinetobacter baumannii]EHU1401035.1 hypothetical protein [Acinetobacter baumannii]